MANLPPSDFSFEATETATVLRQIAESAQELSGATGSAIAIRNGSDRNGEEVLCVARSGDTAPPLGSRLDANSGISGECLLTGRVLHTNDTAADYRVDPEVCRELGLRSIVVIPVRGKVRIAGVLEVFSTKPHAFTREHIDALKSLAEMIEMACASIPAVATRQDLVLPVTQPSEPLSAPIRLPFSLSLLKDKRGYWIAGGAMAIVLLVTLISLKAFHSTGIADNSKPTPSAVTPSPPESAEILLQGSASNVDRKNNRGRRDSNSDDERHPLQKASKVEVLSRPTKAASGDANSLTYSPNMQDPPQTQATEPDSNQAPTLPLAANSTTPEVLMVPSVTMPTLIPAVTQGVVGGILEHQVKPVYPREALAMRLEGDVILAATITKTGEVRNLKILKGSPLLGGAAIDAVRQWRYQPSRLNGEPIESQTQITVQFRAQ